MHKPAVSRSAKLASRRPAAKWIVAGASLLILSLFPANGRAATLAENQAICANESGARAMAACTSLIVTKGLSPHSLAAAYINRGVLASDAGDLDNAIADLTQAILIDPSYELARANRGRMYQRKGDLRRAEADFVAALKLDPTDADTRVELVNVHSKMRAPGYKPSPTDAALSAQATHAVEAGLAANNNGRHEEAIKAFTRALGDDPMLARAYALRGFARGDKGEWEAAIADGLASVRLAPKNANYSYLLGFSLMAVKDYERAIASFDRAAQLAPNVSDYVYMIGQAEEEKGELPAAIADYRRALILNPGDKDAKAALARLAKAQTAPPSAVSPAASESAGPKVALTQPASSQAKPAGAATKTSEESAAPPAAPHDTAPELIAKAQVLESKGDYRAAASKYAEALNNDKEASNAKTALLSLNRDHLTDLCDGSACAEMALSWDAGCLILKNNGTSVVDYTIARWGAAPESATLAPGYSRSYKYNMVMAFGAFPSAVKFCATAEEGEITSMAVSRDTGKAQDDWLAFLKNKQDTESLLKKGTAAREAGDLDTAITTLQSALTADQSATTIAKNRDFDTPAMEELNGRIHDALGVTYEKKGALVDATANLNLALEIDPKNVGYLVDTARVRALREQYWSGGGTHFGAIGLLTEAAKLAPDNKQVAQQLSEAKAALAKQDEALRRLCHGDACGDLEMHWNMSCLYLKSTGTQRIQYLIISDLPGDSTDTDMDPQHEASFLIPNGTPRPWMMEDLACTTARQKDFKSISALYFHPLIDCNKDLFACALSK